MPIIFCGVTIFAFGWVAARWNWSLTWRSSLLAGCGAGLLAGCLIFDFIGAFWFGLKGQEEVLRNYYTLLTEHQGLTILVNVITQTAVSIYLNFWAVVSACTFVGALGGLASAMDVKDVWGSAPREPANWLFRLSAYSLKLNGLLNIIVTIAVLTILPERVEKAMLESNMMGPTTLPPDIIAWLGYFTGTMMIFLPLGLTWAWLVRDWRTAGYGRILSAAWLVGTFGLSFYYFFSKISWILIARAFPSVVVIFF